MKKLMLILFVMASSLAYGQKIKENTVDKFTGQKTVCTTQEALAKRNKWKNEWQQVLVSVRKVDNEWAMPAFIELEDIEKYDDDSQMILLLSNGDKITMRTLYTGIGAEDCPIGIGGVNPHVHGFSTVFPMSESDVCLLRQNDISDIRITTLGASHDFPIGKKEQSVVKKMIELIDKSSVK